MSSWEDVAYESSYHYQKQKDHPHVPGFFIEIGAVVKTPSDVQIDADEEEGGSVSVEIPD